MYSMVLVVQWDLVPCKIGNSTFLEHVAGDKGGVLVMLFWLVATNRYFSNLLGRFVLSLQINQNHISRFQIALK